MDGFFLAFGFLTVLPMPFVAARPGGIGRAAVWFPVVGLVVGALLAAVAWGSLLLWHDRGIAAALVLIASLLLTGGLHLDGFMDTADAFFSHKDRERMLEIMKDSRSGALGVASGVVLLIAKFAAISALLGHSGRLPLVLLAVAPVLGRAAMVFALGFPNARPGGLGASFASEVRPWQRELSSGLAVLLTVGVVQRGGLWWGGPVLFAVTAAVALLSVLYWKRRLGGLTGDIYGAINECVELAVLLAAVALLR